ncbi:MAG: hypothetical protein KDD44_06030, partial [Bdellovibrionales bacterium]|nr:hypothetical protein [Bdellovibrionales bacterium]
MKIAIVINDFTREKGKYTSMRLAVAASNRGHAVWVFGAGDFHYGDDGKIYARARRATRSNHKSSIVYLDDLRGGDHVEE